MQEAIESALQTAVTPILNRLIVREVVQQGGSLAVILGPSEATEALDLREAAKAVEQATPMLRREVALAITRKETPNLNFVLLPADAQKIDE